ncbi:hypothetical protein GCM10028793_00770 [Nocardiopsis oceani]
MSPFNADGRAVSSRRRAVHPESHMYDMIEYPSTPDTDDEIARALQDAINRRD